MPMVDADAHVIESERTWDFLEPSEQRFRPVRLTPIESTTGRRYWLVDGNIFPKRTTPQGPQPENETPAGTADMSDLETRLRHMDELGIDVQVLYPTLSLGPLTHRPEVDVALCRSYNRWLADIWARAPRFRWVVVPPLLSMSDAIAELEVGKRNGACGVFMRGIEGDRFLNDPYFYPLYEQASRLNLPICIHSGNGNASLWDFGYRDRDQPLFFGAVLPVLAAFHAIVHSEIPALFPELRFGFIEAGSQWVPYMLREEARRLERKGTPLKDDPLRANRLYITCRTDDDLRYVLEYASEDNLIIGTDYGHKDVASEIAALQTLKRGGGVKSAIVDKILDDNPRAFYGI